MNSQYIQLLMKQEIAAPFGSATERENNYDNVYEYVEKVVRFQPINGYTS